MHFACCRLERLLALGAAGLLTLSACSDSTAPIARARTVFVTSAEEHHITLVDALSGDVTGVVALQDAVLTAAMSGDGSTLYLAEGRSSAGNLVALDTRSHRLLWEERQSSANDIRADRWGGLGVSAYDAMAVSSDNSLLYAAPAFKGDKLGVAALSTANRDLHASELVLLPDWRGLVMLPAASTEQKESLLLAGRELPQDPYGADWLFMLDPSTLIVQDSLAVVDPAPDGSRALIQPTPSPDGQYVYVQARGATSALVKYDLATRQVVASAPANRGLLIALSPDGDRLYEPVQSDGPDDVAALLVYDDALNLLATIALPDIGHRAPVVQDVAVSSDGLRVYVLAGTGSRVPDGRIQSAQLVAVDPVARRILWSKPLNEWGANRLFVR